MNARGHRSRHLHDFPAVDVALLDFPQRTTQFTEVQRLLDTALRTEICVSPFGDLRVVLENLSPGHNFPSGASQHRRLWVEIRGYDQEDEPLFTYGVPPEGTPIVDAADAWLLRDLTFKANGEPAHMFWDVARVEEGTIPAPVTRDPVEPVKGLEDEVLRVWRKRLPAVFDRESHDIVSAFGLDGDGCALAVFERMCR